MISAFGVDHGDEVVKGLPSALRARPGAARSAYAQDKVYTNIMGKQMRPRFKERNMVTDIGPRMLFAQQVKRRPK